MLTYFYRMKMMGAAPKNASGVVIVAFGARYDLQGIMAFPIWGTVMSQYYTGNYILQNFQRKSSVNESSRKLFITTVYARNATQLLQWYIYLFMTITKICKPIQARLIRLTLKLINTEHWKLQFMFIVDSWKILLEWDLTLCFDIRCTLYGVQSKEYDIK